MKRNRALPYWVFGLIFLSCGMCVSFRLSYAGEKLSPENLANLIIALPISFYGTIICIRGVARCDKEFWDLDHKSKMWQLSQVAEGECHEKG